MTTVFAFRGERAIARVIIAIAAAALFATTAAQAGEKGNQGRGRGQAEKADKGDRGGPGMSNGKFSGGDRAAVRAYYDKAAKCPPGLAKKGNGCLPPGQAKKPWAVGQALPPTVTFEAVPAELSIHLSLPPAGHRYVQVAGDILMIAEGSRIVVDAVIDLGR